MEFVFSNREPGEAQGSDEFFGLVHSYGLPLVTLSSSRYRQEHGGGPTARHRLGYDRAAMRLLQEFKPDVCVLAGYMLICSSEMCQRYPLLNLHGALPDGPTGAWQSVIWQLIESGATQTGAMIHLATEEVDRGPVLSHCVVPIVGGEFDTYWRELAGRDLAQVRRTEGDANALFQRIRVEGYRREPHLMLATLKAVSEGRLNVKPGLAFNERLESLSKGTPPDVGDFESGIRRPP
jgi:folate-dependent phosphoribosylglycinamide formyltransferase PurN